ncbi:MAG TPA: hypothetical protein VG817_02970 [Gemmatimonadales bacterium]|nr:hypothetical protein [Gemmatimonadales bacterium]
MKTATSITIPELGPALGKLVVPALPGTPGPVVPLEDLRLKLVSQIFELAGDARRWLREGDRALAVATIDRDAWEGCWNTAVQAVAHRIAEKANARMLAAGQESRISARRLAALALNDDELRSLAARLDQAGEPLRQALVALDALSAAARSERASPEAVEAWKDGLATTARRTEAAWLALEERVLEEWRRWETEIAGLRGWRRPTWPLVLISVTIFLLFLWIGLMIGGYVTVPGPLVPAAEWVWARWN